MTKGLACVILALCLQLANAQYPSGFMWGTATAAYQVEGGYQQDSRGPCVWDIWTHQPGHIANNQNGDVADNHYNLFQEDIQLIKSMGMTHFRFSISWSRIFPDGNGVVNQKGIDHYNAVIDTLLKYNIQPLVTLYHWDLPQALQDRYLGWVGDQVVKDYLIYADTCFRAFGDRVKYWLTFNEPLEFCYQGYATGGQAPGRCSDRSKCPAGNSTTEPWLCAHNVLRSHARTVALYRAKYQPQQQGKIAITLDSSWSIPATNSTDDIEATQRHLDFTLGWFAHPVYLNGDYPAVMKKALGTLLPTFSADEQQMLRGSSDFFGINHYTTNYVSNAPGNGFEETSVSSYRNGVPIGPRAQSTWLFVYPPGMRGILNYIRDTYHPPAVVVTENGVDVPNENSMPLNQALNDTFRIDYYDTYLQNVLASIQEDGVNVRGYFAWSLLDNFEWADGYSSRFGIHYVDYESPSLDRYAKQSMFFLRDYIKAQSAKKSSRM